MELKERQIVLINKRLKRYSNYGITAILLLFLVTLVSAFLFKDYIELASETKLIIKTALFILFFGTIPLMFYIVRFRIRKMPAEAQLKEKLRFYTRLYNIKFLIYSILSFLSLIAFFFVFDPMILLLIVIGVFFTYFERPSADKIYEDVVPEKTEIH